MFIRKTRVDMGLTLTLFEIIKIQVFGSFLILSKYCLFRSLFLVKAEGGRPTVPTTSPDTSYQFKPICQTSVSFLATFLLDFSPLKFDFPVVVESNDWSGFFDV